MKNFIFKTQGDRLKTQGSGRASPSPVILRSDVGIAPYKWRTTVGDDEIPLLGEMAAKQTKGSGARPKGPASRNKIAVRSTRHLEPFVRSTFLMSAANSLSLYSRVSETQGEAFSFSRFGSTNPMLAVLCDTYLLFTKNYDIMNPTNRELRR